MSYFFLKMMKNLKTNWADLYVLLCFAFLIIIDIKDAYQVGANCDGANYYVIYLCV